MLFFSFLINLKILPGLLAPSQAGLWIFDVRLRREAQDSIFHSLLPISCLFPLWDQYTDHHSSTVEQAVLSGPFCSLALS